MAINTSRPIPLFLTLEEDAYFIALPSDEKRSIQVFLLSVLECLNLQSADSIKRMEELKENFIRTHSDKEEWKDFLELFRQAHSPTPMAEGNLKRRAIQILDLIVQQPLR